MQSPARLGQLDEVAALELLEPLGIVRVPLPQLRRRRNVLALLVQVRGHLREAPGPKPVDQDPRAVIRGAMLVDPPNPHGGCVLHQESRSRVGNVVTWPSARWAEARDPAWCSHRRRRQAADQRARSAADASVGFDDLRESGWFTPVAQRHRVRAVAGHPGNGSVDDPVRLDVDHASTVAVSRLGSPARSGSSGAGQPRRSSRRSLRRR